MKKLIEIENLGDLPLTFSLCKIFSESFRVEMPRLYCLLLLYQAKEIFCRKSRTFMSVKLTRYELTKVPDDPK